MPWRDLWKGKGKRGEELPLSPPPPRHVGELWPILQAIAREEDPRFETRSVAEHLHAGAEGHRDVLRWIAIYEARVGAGRSEGPRSFSFPPHLERHRGHVLAPRCWPHGVVWEAFEEASLRRALVGPANSREELRALLDALLDTRLGGPLSEAAGRAHP